MRQIKIDTVVTDKNHDGVFSFILPDGIVDLDKLYDRKGLCLKIFKDDPYPLEKFTWGYKKHDKRVPEGKEGPNHLLTDCTIIQNLFAMEGLAPRVYDIVIVSTPQRDYFAQVTDRVEGEFTEAQNKLVSELKAKYHLFSYTDPNEKNWINGKLIDFQGFKFADREKYEERLRELANTKTDWGSKSGISYESVEALGVTGQRDTVHRAEMLGMDTYTFKDKTVLDIGCSTGSFCRLAESRLAKRVVGMDLEKEVMAAWEISNYLHNWNIDFIPYRFHRDDLQDYEMIKQLTNRESFDIVFFLSVNAQIGYPTKYMKDLCSEIVFCEGHSGENEMTYRPLLEADFRRVEFKGRMKNNARPAIVGIK